VLAHRGTTLHGIEGGRRRDAYDADEPEDAKESEEREQT
jgi:hypothetical protein